MSKSPTLESSFYHRALTLCALYFAQGVPWGFVTIALVAYLNELGVSRQETALLISMSILPWTFKLIWGPIIDSFQLPGLGRRRPWILFAQAMMAVTLFAASTSRSLTDPEILGFLVLVFFVHNCFAALQDVATDAMAIDILPPNERGRMNGFMWGSKLVGISLGGVVLANVIVRYGLTTGVRMQGVLVLLIMLLPLLLREREGDRLFPWSPRDPQPALAQESDSRSPSVSAWRRLVEGLARPIAVARELGRAFSLRTTILAGLVALGSIVAEGFHDAVTPAVFTQTLGWSAESYAGLQGIWGTIGKMVGALAGGFLCDRYGRRLIAGASASACAATFIGFGVTSALWASSGYPYALFIFMAQGTLAMTTVALFSLYMKVSWTTAAATQFTMFMTLANMGYAAGPYLTRLGLTDTQSYVVCGAAAVLPMLLLPLMKPDGVERRRVAEFEARRALQEAAA